MPPTDLASGVTDVLGVTVRQLELRRLEGGGGASQAKRRSVYRHGLLDGPESSDCAHRSDPATLHPCE
jgi:hypothetical protein